jgi:hypothetical protein
MDCGYPHNLTQVFWHGVSTMKSRKPLLFTLAAGAFLFAGTLIAQDASPPPQSTMSDVPAAPATAPMPSAPTHMRQVPPMSTVPGNTPMPPAPSTPAAVTMPASAPTPPTPPGGQAAAYPSPQGAVVVQTAPAPAPTIGPAPTFEQLSGGGKSISPEQASAYPPLANDFINADTNRNGSISKTEYANWLKQL